eukprot:GHVT01020291.1.p1 GENE.GHVT01020291.1~~GHVT01020291.1.p1  ORF type:complete len:519 (-),score=69.27 GHVT01020291.1:513-2069(-)
MILRFDDTNPTKEKEEFEESIKEDLDLLDVKPDQVSHTSDYFEELQKFAEKLIGNGLAYVDDTPTMQMREERSEGIESARRSATVEENMNLWNEMLKGSVTGLACCLRAKISMTSKNKCMRDPVLYRCVADVPHHRHGFKYKAYPTYDFACPIVDSIEGVTHAMRTNEYSDRIEQYHWVLKSCGLRDVFIYEFSRLNFVRTILSKRKLTWFVENQIVTGWDDPRLATVRGIVRRGLAIPALLDFLLEQGPSKAGNLMEWDKLWTKNKQVIDPVAPRYMAVAADAIEISLVNGPTTVCTSTRPLHPKNVKLGEANILQYQTIYIDRDDAVLCEEGEEVTLMRWGNCILDSFEKSPDGSLAKIVGRLHLEGDFKKTKKKIHWLPKLPSDYKRQLSAVVLREYDHLITVDKLDKTEEGQDFEEVVNRNSLFDTRGWADPLVKHLPAGVVLQLERRGYFRVDVPADISAKAPAVLVKIPDGKSKAMSTVTTKVDAATLSGSKKTDGTSSRKNESTKTVETKN